MTHPLPPVYAGGGFLRFSEIRTFIQKTDYAAAMCVRHDEWAEVMKRLHSRGSLSRGQHVHMGKGGVAERTSNTGEAAR